MVLGGELDELGAERLPLVTPLGKNQQCSDHRSQGLLDDTLGAAALACAQATIRADYRNDAGNPFGPEVSAPDDATDWERLGAFMGRSPR